MLEMILLIGMDPKFIHLLINMNIHNMKNNFYSNIIYGNKHRKRE